MLEAQVTVNETARVAGRSAGDSPVTAHSHRASPSTAGWPRPIGRPPAAIRSGGRIAAVAYLRWPEAMLRRAAETVAWFLVAVADCPGRTARAVSPGAGR